MNFINDFLTWLGSNSMWTYSLLALSAVMFLVTPIIIGIVVTRMPADYFATKQRGHTDIGDRHPLMKRLMKFGKNLLGVVLIIAGIAMLVLPGQGILTMLIGLTLVNFPGKYKLERALIGRPTVLRAINWIRRKTGVPEMIAPVRTG